MWQILLYLQVFILFSVHAHPNIVRPCGLGDLKCIRDNFQVNSKCNPKVSGSIPGEYTMDKFTFHTPFFNATYVDNNLIIRNHDKCYVSEFFFNMDSDHLVFSLDCPNLNFESNRTMIQHESYMEDRIFSYLINGTYPLVRLTTTMGKADHISFCDDFVFAEVPYLPIFHINPNDRRTLNHLTRDLTMLKVYEAETFFYRGPELMRKFMKNMICDFGC